jgi:cellulose biosynthesis protein BcsQ
MMVSETLVGELLERFDQLPVWAKVLILLVIALLAVRGFINSVLAPTRDALQQLRVILERCADWMKAKLAEKGERPKPTVRMVPLEKTVWEENAPDNPPRPLPTSIPIITVANMKGGVGKTTIAANLAVALRDKLQKRVLVIDFDYQGSLSQCIRGEANFTDPDLTADVLLGNTGDDPLTFARPMPNHTGVQGIHIFPATYPFATIENRLQSDWLVGSGPNLLYRLCEQLRRPEVQQTYGAVVIDSPPRLTPGSVNALCASTHLLVPTTLDDMSAQAVLYFLDQISRMKETLFPTLRLLGVVPSIIYRDGHLLEEEGDALARLKQYGQNVWNRNDFVLEEARIPRRAPISKYAGKGVAYAHHADAQAIFSRLAEAVQSRF